MRAERRDRAGRRGRRSQLLEAASATFFCGNRGAGGKKEKRSKKERNGGLWELAPLMEIRRERGFPQRLGKHKALSTVPTRPNSRFIKMIYFMRGSITP